jgi:hypothetical protein
VTAVGDVTFEVYLLGFQVIFKLDRAFVQEIVGSDA